MATRICPICERRTDAERCPNDGYRTVDEALASAGNADSLVGTRVVGQFTLQRRLGSGGYGSVYLAEHEETGGHVAIKLLRPEAAGPERAGRVIRRFYAEARNTHRLTHPNTVRLSDFGQTEDGRLFLVMEYVRGTPLSRVLAEHGPMPASRVVRIAEQVLKSLGEAHALGIIHRDVKPHNIMLVDQYGEPDFVKVLDFGVSRDQDASVSHSGSVVGTPRYMAPEQWRGDDVDGRTDLYAVGCLMYELLTGRMAFDFDTDGSGRSPSSMALMHAHVSTPPKPLLEVAPSACPQELAALVEQMMAKAPGQRPAGVHEVLERLHAIKSAHGLGTDVRFAEVGGNVLAARSSPAPSLAAGPGAGSDVISATMTQEPRSGSRSEVIDLSAPAAAGDSGRAPGRRTLLVAAMVAAVAIAVGIAVTRTPSAVDPPASSPPAPATVSSEPADASPPPPASAPDEAEPSAPGPSQPAVDDAPPAPARLVVRSTPAGAAVSTRDGRSLGVTPLTLEHPPQPARMGVVVSAGGHVSTSLELTFGRAGETVREHVTLAAAPPAKATASDAARPRAARHGRPAKKKSSPQETPPQKTSPAKTPPEKTPAEKTPAEKTSGRDAVAPPTSEPAPRPLPKLRLHE